MHGHGTDSSERIARSLRRWTETRKDGRPVSILKARLMTASFMESEGQPQVVRIARAFAAVLENVPVSIADDDLLLGNLASKPGGVELSSLWAGWDDGELDALETSGFIVDPADRPAIAEMNAYWRTRSLTGRMTSLYNDERLWPYAQLGVVLPPFRDKSEGWGPGGMLGCGWGVHHEISQIIGVFDYRRVLDEGLASMREQAAARLDALRLFSLDDVRRSEQLTATILALDAVLTYAERLADAAADEARGTACADRREQLLDLAAMCRKVPRSPAGSFREAMQSLWIIWLMILPSGVMSFGRLDQLLGGYFAADLEDGRITREAALDLLQWLRLRDSQITIASGQTHRAKHGGHAKWHNCVIGGQDAAGRDATNEVTYLLLEAAAACPVPHPTLTMRVHAGTPPRLMDEALKLASTGIGLPTFVGDEAVLAFFEGQDIPRADARDYAVGGCLCVGLVGQSRMVASPMFTATKPLVFALHGGADPATGAQVGPRTPPLAECKTFDEFRAGVYDQLSHFIELQAEFNNVTLQSYADVFPQPFETSLTHDWLDSPDNVLGRRMRFENGSAINLIGMVNVADSLAAIKVCVFETKSVSASDLLTALAADWAGEDGQRVRQAMLAAPKFGNDDDIADREAVMLFAHCAQAARSHPTVYGGRNQASALSVGTSTLAGGAATGATPDGRESHEGLADESLSAMRGRQAASFRAALRSALKVDARPWQALSLDLSFEPSLFRSSASRERAAEWMREYFAAGGMHIQLNVNDRDVLRAAMANPQAHRDLVVRIGGCSSYFTELPVAMQTELLERQPFASFD